MQLVTINKVTWLFVVTAYAILVGLISLRQVLVSMAGLIAKSPLWYHALALRAVALRKSTQQRYHGRFVRGRGGDGLRMEKLVGSSG
jgi:hypothetical protein